MLKYYLLVIVIGYFLGCIECGYYVGKILKGVDIREYGSGNPGSTNVLRTLGWQYALLTFLGDALKGFIPVMLVKLFLSPHLPGVHGELIQLVTGFAVVIGHNYPFNLKFKGGKGAASTGAIMLAFDWRMGLMCLAIFIVVVALTRYVSLGSMLYSVCLVIEMAILHPHWQLVLMVALFPIFSIYRHRSNISRLLAGTESKIGQKVSVNKEPEDSGQEEQ
ncbi:MAG: glycerol-3-phosphate 1-O-acyltransferase PlsY [Eubacterium sp.]|nr:glycerol-3-phosphate 1-O-acyltransferase PlsY [Eubacterium sp.]